MMNQRTRKTTNKKIREEMTKTGIKQWEIAMLLRIGESTFCRWMRTELPEDEQDRIVDLIRKNSEEKAV